MSLKSNEYTWVFKIKNEYTNEYINECKWVHLSI